MRESRTYGSVRGARGNSRPYREGRCLLQCMSPFMCRFSDAGMTRLSTSCGGRRPKSAKARSRGKWGTGGAAGAVQPRVRDLSAG
jgi:hypothetical protein